MRNLVLMSLLLTGLAACGGNKVSDLTDSAAMYCVNRGEIIEDAGAPLARMCGENSLTYRTHGGTQHDHDDTGGDLVVPEIIDHVTM